MSSEREAELEADLEKMRASLASENARKLEYADLAQRHFNAYEALRAQVASGPRRERLPDERSGVRKKLTIPRPGHPDGHLRMYVTVNTYPDGRPGEIFIKADRTGSLVSGALDAVAVCLSVAWQHGVPMATIVHKLAGMRFDPSGATGDKTCPIVASPLDYVARWLLIRFPEQEGAPTP